MVAIPCGFNYLQVQFRGGSILCGFNPVRVQSHVGSILCGFNSVWVQSRVGSIPCGFNPVWVQSRVGSIPWVQSHWVQSRLGSIPMEPSFLYLYSFQKATVTFSKFVCPFKMDSFYRRTRHGKVRLYSNRFNLEYQLYCQYLKIKSYQPIFLKDLILTMIRHDFICFKNII